MTSFDKLMNYLNEEKGFHHPRAAQSHSDQLSKFIIEDLLMNCHEIREDARNREISFDLNVNVAADISDHIIDLVIGDLNRNIRAKGLFRTNNFEIVQSSPLENRYRILIEHKSVITAHRNKKNRLRDLKEFASHSYNYRSSVIICGTIMVGTAVEYFSVENLGRYLKALGRINEDEEIKARLCKNDKTLYQEYKDTTVITTNRIDDPDKTFNLFLNEIPIRNSIEERGFDAFYSPFIHIDNLRECRVDNAFMAKYRENINNYNHFISQICNNYNVRF